MESVVSMPNKTIYVSEDDLGLLEKAKKQSGDNLSATISLALRYYLNQNNNANGFEKVVLKVGKAAYTLKRFEGRLLGKAVTSATEEKSSERFEVYETVKGNFVLYHAIPPSWSGFPGPDGNWLSGQTEFRFEVHKQLGEFKDRLPEELLDVIGNMLIGNEVEDLDI